MLALRIALQESPIQVQRMIVHSARQERQVNGQVFSIWAHTEEHGFQRRALVDKSNSELPCIVV